MNPTKIRAIVLMVVSVVLAVVLYLVLPASVITQFGVNGVSRTPKALAILMCFVFSEGGALIDFFVQGENAKKGAVVSLVSIFAGIMMLVFNH